MNFPSAKSRRRPGHHGEGAAKPAGVHPEAEGGRWRTASRLEDAAVSLGFRV
jgi:hypothetical protein